MFFGICWCSLVFHGISNLTHLFVFLSIQQLHIESITSIRQLMELRYTKRHTGYKFSKCVAIVSFQIVRFPNCEVFIMFSFLPELFHFNPAWQSLSCRHSSPEQRQGCAPAPPSSNTSPAQLPATSSQLLL